jgi:hypothetical protein
MRSMVCRMLAVVSALAALAGCGAPASDAELEALGEGELGTLEQALSANCGSTGPVQRVFNARAAAFTATAALQAQGCDGDSYMFSIQSYNSGVNPLQNPKIRPANAPTNKADCEATELRFYVWSGAVLKGSTSEHGRWQGGSLGCVLTLSAPAALVPGGNYKFAISARRPADVPIAVRLEHLFV